MPWPPLSDFKSISGRYATEEDVNTGAAVFMLRSEGENIGVPLDIQIPQYAIHTDQETGEKTRVVVIQAEEANGSKVIGAVNIITGEHVAALYFEFEFLGTNISNEM